MRTAAQLLINPEYTPETEIAPIPPDSENKLHDDKVSAPAEQGSSPSELRLSITSSASSLPARSDVAQLSAFPPQAQSKAASASVPNVSSSDLQLKPALSNLRSLTRWLRFFSVLAAGFLVLFLIFVSAVILVSANVLSMKTGHVTDLVWVGALLLIIGATCVIVFERLARTGDATFDVISAELQRIVLVNQRSDQAMIGIGIDIETRISLREFLKATDLPMVPGRYGPAVYLVFLFSIFLFSVIWITLRH